MSSRSERPRASRSVDVVPGCRRSSAGIVDAAPRGELVDGRHARRARARRAAAALEPLPGGHEPGSQRRDRRRVVLQAAADDAQRLPEAGFADLVAGGTRAAGVAGLTGRQRHRGTGRELGQGLIEARRAELVSGAVRSAAFDTVVPALARAVDQRGGLTVVDRQRLALGGHDLLKVVAVGHLHDVPVVQEEQLARLPLDVVAGLPALAADALAVDRGLVPVEVQHDVGEARRAGGGQSFGDAARREPSFSLRDVDPRAVRAVTVAGGDGQADGARQTDAGGAGREVHEGGRRRRVPVQGPGVQGGEQRRRGRRVAAKAEQVFEAQATDVVAGQELRRAEAGDLVAQGPERVEAHGLVSGGIREHVGVVTIGAGQVVVETVEQDRLRETPRRDRTAGVARGRHVVEQQGAQRTVEQIEGLEGGQLGGRQRALPRRRRGRLDTDRAPWSKRGCHHTTPSAGPAGRPSPLDLSSSGCGLIAATRRACRARRPARRRQSRTAARRSALAGRSPESPRRRRGR